MAIGGTIFEVELDLTHPLAFGLHQDHFPVYRNSRVVLEPSENPYATVASYTMDPHIDGYIAPENLTVVKGSAALLVNGTGRGRSILFADNPNFRGIWWGTQRMFLNALFFGNIVEVPR
ncbi:MAG: zinc carboxypeptidase, partial [Bacteroidota bacterium]